MNQRRIDSDLRNKSLINLQNSSNHFIEVFKNLVLTDIERLNPIKRVNPDYIINGIKSLEKKKDIIIRPADKGGGVVILEKTFYHKQLVDMLGDRTTYCRLSSDPTNEYRAQLSALVEWGYSMDALNGREKNYLVPSSCRIPIIYMLPKIHKDVRVPPARPIVNGIGSVTARLGEFLDKFLQPSVKATRAYLKDTTDLLRSLQEVKFDPTSEVYLVTADVASLYTIIQHEDAALALN